ncbi:hypothetical protein ASG47_06870 [Devosia sp. Leaf420]|uniref:DUF6492 family protein n=1 Tax=Devosia sp. Leaf420 TaxID=1736374 RepID=UPI000714C73E|nr:DUF6492 family protein [Devosia sp. Leaf420]KQT48098.1 hypothetical protein ASG47_06870 [Devosia sp. Leaf420]
MTASISLITPSYSGDFASCQLLCESMDKFVSGYDMHYIVVGDEDVSLFAPLAGPKRRIVSNSALLPKFWSIGRWRGRRYWWAPGLGLPVYGWHLQQLRKIAMTLQQDSDWVMCVDSDNCFCRPFDLGEITRSNKIPHFVTPAGIKADRPNHIKWLNNAHALLGLPAPTLPHDDFIGPMIVWERETVRVMVEKIETLSKKPWWSAIARQRQFSEYLIYGAAVASDPAIADRHERTTDTWCLTYWEGPALNEQSLADFIRQLAPHQNSITIQSHTQTPAAVIRKVVLA